MAKRLASPHSQTGKKMMILLTADDLAAFSDSTRNEILRRLNDVVGDMPSRAPFPAPNVVDAYDDIHASDLEDITFKRMKKWMDGLSDPVRAGVRIIAQHGPVIEACLLREAGINVRHFQSATTRRTRALTGDSDAYFLGWNNWLDANDPNGKFAVSPITHQSLQRYFGFI
ncbi:hypothetical protein MRBLSP13_003726 [Sphingobium sp. LSP13-1-1.1]